MGYAYHLMTVGMMYAVLAVAYNLLIGYAGLVSLAQAAFFGIGAYGAGMIAVKFGGQAFLVSVLCGAVLAAAVASLVAAASLKWSEDYLIVATLGLQIMFTVVLLNWVDVTGGARGLPVIPRGQIFGFILTRENFLWVTLLVGTACIAFMWYLAASPYGRIIKATRDNAVAAQALGRNVTWYRTQILLISGFISGLMGGLFAYYIRFVEPSSFTIDQTNLFLAMVIFGGMANVWGSVIGAFLLIGLSEIFSVIEFPPTIVGPARQMMFGGIIVLCMLFRPQGLFGERFESGGESEEVR